jgi:hypothetical protein
MPDDYDHEDDVWGINDDDVPRHRSGLRLLLVHGGHHERRKAREELERQASDEETANEAYDQHDHSG